MRRFSAYAANTLTAGRVLLSPIFVYAARQAEAHRIWGVLAVVVFALAAASDVWDGRVARRFRSAGRGGRIFDHFADIVFLLFALGTYVDLGIAPWWVPAAIASGFAYYVVDSRRRTLAGPLRLIGSRIGHVGGICNYVLVGVLVCNNSAGIGLLSSAFLTGLFSLVPLYSAAAVAARLAAPAAVPEAVREAGYTSAASS
jgi:phosphatidylglycerophosphate synthase